MGRRRRRSLVMGLLAAAVLVASGAHRAWAQTPDTGRYVFDLDSDHAIVDEHTARITWHLMVDNLTTDARADSVWYSVYADRSSEMGGRVIVDLDSGVVSGEITEAWICLGCRGWRSYDTTLTATIRDGTLTAEDDGWTIKGKVDIRYRAEGSADESPSICGTEECFNCRRRICRLDVTQRATANLAGRFEGDTLHLAFADRLAADPSTMDVGHLADTEYFMSRFSTTVTGTVPPGGSDTTTTAAATTSATTTASTTTDTTSGGEPEARDDTTTSEVEAPAAQAQPTDPTNTRRGAGWLIAIVILTVITAGAIGLVISLIVRYRMGWSLKEVLAGSAADPGASADIGDGGSAPQATGEAGREPTGGIPDHPAPSATPPPAPPPTPPVTPTVPGGTVPPPPAPPSPPATSSPPSTGGASTPGAPAQTSGEYHASRPGIKPGGYRFVEFPEGVDLWEPAHGSTVEGEPTVVSIAHNVLGPHLIGDPDPGLPGYSPVYDNAGKRIGWVSTSDLPD